MSTTGLLLAVAALFAVLDWVAVGTGNRAMEYVFKPATMVPLIIAAATLDGPSSAMQVWFTVALVLSLAGDVFLMLPDEETWFVPGLGSFLLGHVAYVIGLLIGGINGLALVAGGTWGRWSPGTLDQRCFTHQWPELSGRRAVTSPTEVGRRGRS